MTEQAQEATTFEESTVGEGTTMEDQMNQEAAEAVDTAATAAEAYVALYRYGRCCGRACAAARSARAPRAGRMARAPTASH